MPFIKGGGGIITAVDYPYLPLYIPFKKGFKKDREPFKKAFKKDREPLTKSF